MAKLQNLLRVVLRLSAIFVFSFVSVAKAQVSGTNNERLITPQAGPQQNAGELISEIRALREELRQTSKHLDSRLQNIENTLNLNPGKEPAQQQPLPPAESKLAVPHQGAPAAPISVCSKGCDFNDLQKAVDASAPGNEIDVAPEINGTCAVINKPLHIIGKRAADGRRAHLAGGVCIGKGPLVTAAGNITIEGFEISGVSVSDGNGACLRLDPGTRDLTVKDILCRESQNGMLGESQGHLLIEDSSFIGNGFGNGQAHGLYVGGEEVVIRRCRILATQNAGHSLKSGARKLTVEDSIIAALNGRNSRALDAYSGGEIVLLRNVIEQGPNSDNSDVIGLALESQRLQPDGHALRLENNWVIFDGPYRGVLLRGRKLGPIITRNNNFVGLKSMGLDGEDIGNHWYDSRQEAGLPPFDGSLSSLSAGIAKE